MPTLPQTTDLAPSAAQLAELRDLIRQGSPLVCNERPEPEASPLRRLTGPIGPRRLLDCLAGAPGSGAGLISLGLCREACTRRGELVVVDPAGDFYPPAAIAWGCDPRRLLVVSPEKTTDALAAVETALRSPAVGAVWARLARVDGRAFRRLLLAAEAGDAFGALVRPGRYEPDPSWGDAQLRFDPHPTPEDPDAALRVRVTQTRNRHGPAGGAAMLALDQRTGRIEEIPPDDLAPTQRRQPDARAVAARLAGPTAAAPTC